MSENIELLYIHGSYAEIDNKATISLSELCVFVCVCVCYLYMYNI